MEKLRREGRNMLFPDHLPPADAQLASLRSAAIGRINEQMPAGLEKPGELSESRVRIGDVLQTVRRIDNIERSIRKRRNGVGQFNLQRLSAKLDARSRYLKSVRVVACFAELIDAVSPRAPIIYKPSDGSDGGDRF